MFTQNFESKDLKFTEKLAKHCQTHPKRKIDLRPYMIHNPYTVFTTDTVEKCSSIFRTMHLRHMPVVHPGTGALKGVITRKDLFKFMDY